LVQARDGEIGRVTDVVQPRRGFQQIGVRAKNGRKAACPGGDALDVRPAAGERFLQECPCELLRPGCQCGHAAQARRLRRDIHGRGRPSGDVLPGVTSRHPAMQA
jgi:hypothetical protein